MTAVTVGNLNSLAEFDAPFQIVNGELVRPADVWAPEVYHSEENDIDIQGDGWYAMTGYTGQDRYNGPVMHASEYLGGGMAEDLIEMATEEPDTVFVVVTVEVLPDDDDDEEPNPAGWVVLYR